MPLRRGYATLATGCCFQFNFVLNFLKLKGFLGFAAAAGMSVLAPSPSIAASCGVASFYGGHGDGYAWRTMANGRVMDPNSMIVAHRYLPFGTRLKVTNQGNGKSVIVTVSDRGPYVSGKSLDLSIGAFSRIESPSRGLADVCYSLV